MWHAELSLCICCICEHCGQNSERNIAQRAKPMHRNPSETSPNAHRLLAYLVLVRARSESAERASNSALLLRHILTRINSSYSQASQSSLASCEERWPMTVVLPLFAGLELFESMVRSLFRFVRRPGGSVIACSTILISVFVRLRDQGRSFQ